jgi:anaerobic ribonucleoside-triphosphate reductase activating protein
MVNDVAGTDGVFLDQVTAGISTLGPGLRIVVWVQGCTLACKGCISPHLWERKPRSWVSSQEAAERVLALLPGHAGITISGGEPFQQAEGLATMLEQVRCKSDIDVLLYSGYRLDEILKAGPGSRRLLACADLLIDGRYVEIDGDGGLWRGSANQRLYCLTEKGKEFQEAVRHDHQRCSW